MTRKLRAGALAVVSAAALALAGCTGGSSGNSDSDGQITINYWGFEGGTTTETAKKVISDFEAAHDNVKINAVVMDTADFDMKLPSTLGTDSGPDIVYTGTEPNHLGRYVNVGQVSNLSDVWEENGWNKLAPSTQERLTYDGDPYAVGNELETVGLMYNKKIFEKLGLSAPDSLADLETDMDTILKEGVGITPMILACGGPCYAGLHMMHALGYAMIPTADIQNATADGDGSYDDGQWVKVLQKFDEWNQKGYFSADASGIPDENHWASFCSGETAMMVKGPWMFSAMSDCEKENPDLFEFGFVPFPVEDGLPFQAYVGTGKAWMLSSSLDDNQEKRDLCVELVAAMTNQDTFKSWIETDQRFPAMEFDGADYELTGPQQDALGIIQKAGENGGAVDVGFNNSAAETTVWVSGLQGILSGKQTPEQVIDQLQTQLESDQAAWADAAK